MPNSGADMHMHDSTARCCGESQVPVTVAIRQPLITIPPLTTKPFHLPRLPP